MHGTHRLQGPDVAGINFVQSDIAAGAKIADPFCGAPIDAGLHNHCAAIWHGAKHRRDGRHA